MHTIDLAYVGRGLHEELVAYIADQQGYYADEGVHVALRDGCSWDEERLRRGATIGLGRALLSRLADGTPWVALQVNTTRPLFWFLARSGLASLADLAGRRLAVHAPAPRPGASPGSCCAGPASTRTATSTPSSARPATTAWICAGCTTAASTPPWWAAPWRRRR
ncbi:ABC transporter substrate-binding protein [Streptomyces sp. RLB1-33]